MFTVQIAVRQLLQIYVRVKIKLSRKKGMETLNGGGKFGFHSYFTFCKIKTAVLSALSGRYN